MPCVNCEVSIIGRCTIMLCKCKYYCGLVIEKFTIAVQLSLLHQIVDYSIIHHYLVFCILSVFDISIWCVLLGQNL